MHTTLFPSTTQFKHFKILYKLMSPTVHPSLSLIHKLCLILEHCPRCVIYLNLVLATSSSFDLAVLAFTNPKPCHSGLERTRARFFLNSKDSTIFQLQFLWIVMLVHHILLMNCTGRLVLGELPPCFNNNGPRSRNITV